MEGHFSHIAGLAGAVLGLLLWPIMPGIRGNVHESLCPHPHGDKMAAATVAIKSSRDKTQTG